MKIAIAQINPVLGDFSGNRKKIVNFAKKASKDTDLVLFPEMALFGYHPADLLERPSVVDHQLNSLEDLIQELPSYSSFLFGCVQKNLERGKAYHNSAVLVSQGKIQKFFHKQLLPVYDVFDDSRHFHPGNMADNIFELKGKKTLVLICEDMWGWDPIHPINPMKSISENIDLIVNLSASPFTPDKDQRRARFAGKTTEHFGAPLVYTNMVGAQDELIYDGGSFFMNTPGEIVGQCDNFKEDFLEEDPFRKEKKEESKKRSEIVGIKDALVMGVRDYALKTGFKKVHLGLSGGVDSAVVACIAAEALGGENVNCVAMPTSFNATESLSLAKELSNNLKCHFYELPIEDSFRSLINSYEGTFGAKKFSLVHENIQARIRGLFLMAFSNEHNSLLLSTGNKSEYATGYTTLYGDMCGGIAVVGDLLKNQVYSLATHYAQEKVLPQRIIDRPPSAELRPNQKDSDSLPGYDILDRAVENLVCEKRKAGSEIESWVLQRLMLSEFKRWQAPPILRVSQHAFGQGRRMPIAHRARV